MKTREVQKCNNHLAKSLYRFLQIDGVRSFERDNFLKSINKAQQVMYKIKKRNKKE